VRIDGKKDRRPFQEVGELLAQLEKLDTVIAAMTPEERREPANIGMVRRWQIAQATGTTLSEVCTFITQFLQMQALARTMRWRIYKV
jgi:signal recognition particle GTPase